MKENTRLVSELTFGKQLFTMLLILCMLLTLIPVFKTESAAAYTNTGNQAEDIVAYAISQKGIKQSGACAWFITKCAKAAGMTSSQMKLSATMASPYDDDPGQFDFISSKSGNLNYGCQAFTWKDFKEGRYQPQKGDLVFWGSIKSDGERFGTGDLTIQDVVKKYNGKWGHKHVSILVNNSSTTKKLYTINGGWGKNYDYKGVDTYDFSTDSATGKTTSGFGGTAYWAMEFVRPNYSSTTVVDDTEAPFFTDARIMNANLQGYDIVFNAEDNTRISRVMIGTWNDVIGIGEAQWIHPTVSTFPMTVHIDLKDFGYTKDTTYHSNIYVYDPNDNYNIQGVSVVIPDTDLPVFTDARIMNANLQGYDIVFSAEDNTGISRVMIGTWNDVIGIGEAQWIHPSVSTFPMTVHIDLDDYDGVQNTTYHSNIYVYDSFNNYNIRGVSVKIPDTDLPVFTDARIMNANLQGYDIVFSAEDNTGISRVMIGTWNDVIGIGEAQWIHPTVSAFPMTVHIDLDDYDGVQNTTYHSNIYVFDSFDNYNIRGVSVAIPDTDPPVFTNASIENVTLQGYDIVFSAEDDAGISKAMIGTWNDVIGIGEAKWVHPAITSFPMRVHIDLKDFEYVTNTTYHSKIYIYDPSENVSIQAVQVDISDEPSVPPAAMINKGQDSVYDVNEQAIISVNTDDYDTCVLRIYRTPTGGETYLYWQGQLFESEYVTSFSQDGYYSCVFDLTKNNTTVHSSWIGWIVDQPNANINKGQDGLYNLNEQAVISLTDREVNDYDSCALRIYRTPTGGETYLYWQGQLFESVYETSFSQEGYYSCVFDLTRDDTTVHSSWVGWVVKQLEFTVSYNVNGGADVLDTQTKYLGSDLILTTVVPSRNGFAFLGWATSPDAYAAQYQPGDIYSEDADLMLFALWQFQRYENSLKLPTSMNMIETEAFEGLSMQEIILPANLNTIESRAFAECEELRLVEFSSANVTIAEDAFENCESLVFYALPSGSIQSYAEYYGIPFIAK